MNLVSIFMLFRGHKVMLSGHLTATQEDISDRIPRGFNSKVASP